MTFAPQFFHARRILAIVAGVLAPLAAGLSPRAAEAQDFAQSFDAVGAQTSSGPANLVAQGWQFRRVFDAGLSFPTWQQGPWNVSQPAPFQGTGYLSGGISVDPFVTATYAKWVILPSIPGQSAGKIASCWARGFTSEFPFTGSVQIRYSPSGGTSTGTTTTSVGDFTQVIASSTNSIFNAWDHLQGTVPGTGRLAIRWAGTISGGFSGTNLQCNIDDFALTGEGVTPPLPQPGETVHWTTALSPIHLTSQQVIPTGGTLVIDAGVEIWFDFNAGTFVGPEMVSYGGTIRLEGTAKNPVRLRRGVNTPNIPSITVGALVTTGSTATTTPGVLDVNYVDTDISLGAFQSAYLRVRNSSIHRATPIDWTSLTDAQWQTPKIAGGNCSAQVDACTFQNAICEMKDAASIVTGCTFNDAHLRVTRFAIAQPHAITGNTFLNSPRYAPILVDGYDYFVAGNSISGSQWPISLAGAGLTPDSVIPATGNIGNRIPIGGALGSEGVGPMRLPPMSVPYLLRSVWTAGNQYDTTVVFEAGSTIEMGPGAGILFEGVARTEIRGTPEAPVRFVREVAGQPWTSVSTASIPPLTIRNGYFKGANWAVGGVDTLFFAHDCVFEGNQIGLQVGDYCGAVVSKSRFIGNGKGCFAPWASDSGIDQGRFFDYGAMNPNSFEGGIGATTEPPTIDFSEMRHAWWGAASGPQHVTNPGGQGVNVGEWVRVVPFRTTPVDFNDHPPVVDVVPVAKRKLRAGDKILLHWSASDDRAIVAQRLEFRPNSGFNDGVVAIANIPPDARSVEYTIPDTRNGDPVLGADLGTAVFRLIATDDRGQEGWDDFRWSLQGTAAIDIAFTGDFTPIRRIGAGFTAPVSVSSIFEYQFFVDDIPGDMQPLGSTGLDGGAGGIAADRNIMPSVSTNLARLAVLFGDEVFYSPYFTVRPNAQFGDAPPAVALTAPQPGAALVGGTTVNIAWTASDDVALRSFDLQASYDGGQTFHPFAVDLPPTARNYAWKLPPSSGIADVRVRVMARDSRFQVTSDGTSRVVSIVVGSGTCPADLDGDGVVSASDLSQLLANWGSAGAGDIDGDGVVAAADLSVLLASWGVCPR